MPFELKGLVVWTNPFASRAAFPTGMGIKFLDLAPQQKTILDDFVRAKLAKAPPGSRAWARPAAERSRRAVGPDTGLRLRALCAPPRLRRHQEVRATRRAL